MFFPVTVPPCHESVSIQRLVMSSETHSGAPDFFRLVAICGIPPQRADSQRGNPRFFSCFQDDRILLSVCDIVQFRPADAKFRFQKIIDCILRAAGFVSVEIGCIRSDVPARFFRFEFRGGSRRNFTDMKYIFLFRKFFFIDNGQFPSRD